MFFSKRKIIALDESEIRKNDLFVHKYMSKPTKKTTIVIDDNYNAVFLKDGEYINTLSAGKYPVLQKGDKAVGSVEVIFVSKTSKLRIKWGTHNRLEMRDPQTGVVVKIGARGICEVQVGDPRKAYLELIGSDTNFAEMLHDKLRGRLCDFIQPVLAKVMEENHMTYATASQETEKISELIKPIVAEVLYKDYGLLLCSINIEAIIIDDEDIRKIEEATRSIEK